MINIRRPKATFVEHFVIQVDHNFPPVQILLIFTIYKLLRKQFYTHFFVYKGFYLLVYTD